MSYIRASMLIALIFTLLILNISCQQRSQMYSRQNYGTLLEFREELAQPPRSNKIEETSNSESVKTSQENSDSVESESVSQQYQSVPEIDSEMASPSFVSQDQEIVPYDIDTSENINKEIPLEVLEADLFFYFESESEKDDGVVYPRLRTD
ncbi:hypothetical protein ACFLZ8_01550 [Planctomycetota bacterium]